MSVGKRKETQIEAKAATCLKGQNESSSRR